MTQGDEGDRPADPIGGVRVAFDLVHWAGRAVGFPVVVWGTRLGTWGPRANGVAEYVGLLWPFLLAGPGPAGAALRLFALATVGLAGLHGLAGAVRRRRGAVVHSRYWGDSRLDRGTGLAATRRARLAVNLVAVLAGVGAAAAGLPAVGLVLIVGAAGKEVAEAVALDAAAARLRRLADARIEQGFYLDLARNPHGR